MFNTNTHLAAMEIFITITVMLNMLLKEAAAASLRGATSLLVAGAGGVF